MMENCDKVEDEVCSNEDSYMSESEYIVERRLEKIEELLEYIENEDSSK